MMNRKFKRTAILVSTKILNWKIFNIDNYKKGFFSSKSTY